MFCECCASPSTGEELDSIHKAQHLTVLHDADDPKYWQDATYTITLPNDVSTVIPALDMSDPSCIIIQEISGALREWNADVDNAQAQIYDRLLEVNGEPCSSTMLRHKMEEAGCDQLTFTLQRPEQRQVILPKSDRLGIDISFRKGVSVRPWIMGVRGGAMGQWNLEKPRFNVHAHDRILSVSGVSGGPLEIVDKLRRSEDSLMITFLHYADDVQS
ncbi:unnamed protein product [Symbiodinium necroappetens]|uniref:PDZ domain-containing protein n=1 Tax=Symbiodinium necroappetens TaxID=1628268 RepID=A0A812L8M5_9DINO|nr:unnamed protein product [Symbiodinium necroappetens]